MAPIEPQVPNPAGPATPPSESRISARMLVVLGVMFAAMWLWKTNAETTSEKPVPYSTFYNWAKDGKLDSVILDGEGLEVSVR